ncbi:MAG: inositol monophosphatase [Cytophagaceae bacterium]|jgi:myo-inositol-1(or 4)-monophosphatase|nr:inositol monophosphatase [Cytophagaceae bacterium]
MESLEVLCNQACALVKEVGAFIRQEASVFDWNHIEYKSSDHDLVSFVDKESEKRLVKGLESLFPQAGFMGEEGANSAGENGYQWVIDPLDGTTNFMHGMPTYSISVALLQHEQVLIGIVYEINRAELFYAWKNGGAYCNGKRLQVSRATALKDSLFVTGFPYSMRGKANQYFEILKEIVNHSHGLRRLGSAAVDLAYVAAGRFEAYFEYNLNRWDVAGGILLVTEAGGKLSDYDGGENFLDGKQIVASNGTIHEPLLSMIQKHWNA